MCNNSFIIHLHRISGEKNYDKEGKETKQSKKSAAQTWLDLNSAPLELLHGNGPIRLLDSVYVYNNYSENNLY